MKKSYDIGKNDRQLKNILDLAPVAISILSGPGLVFSLANQLYQQLFGRSEEQLLGKNIRQAWPEIESREVDEIFHRVYISGEPYVSHEFEASFMIGEIHRTGFFDLTAQPVKDSNGEVTDILVHAAEVTEQILERKKLE